MSLPIFPDMMPEICADGSLYEVDVEAASDSAFQSSCTCTKVYTSGRSPAAYLLYLGMPTCTTSLLTPFKNQFPSAKIFPALKHRHNAKHSSISRTYRCQHVRPADHGWSRSREREATASQLTCLLPYLVVFSGNNKTMLLREDSKVILAVRGTSNPFDVTLHGSLQGVMHSCSEASYIRYGNGRKNAPTGDVPVK